MTSNLRRGVRFAALGASIATLAFFASPTLAATRGSGASNGTCTGSSATHISLHADDGRLEVQFEVDSGHPGQTWAVHLKQDGTSFFSGQRTTHGASGSFEVGRRVNDRPGMHHFVGRAKNTSNGEVCRATASA